jgi:hypothetical protein
MAAGLKFHNVGFEQFSADTAIVGLGLDRKYTIAKEIVFTGELAGTAAVKGKPASVGKAAASGRHIGQSKKYLLRRLVVCVWRKGTRSRKSRKNI